MLISTVTTVMMTTSISTGVSTSVYPGRVLLSCSARWLGRASTGCRCSIVAGLSGVLLSAAVLIPTGILLSAAVLVTTGTLRCAGVLIPTGNLTSTVSGPATFAFADCNPDTIILGSTSRAVKLGHESNKDSINLTHCALGMVTG